MRALTRALLAATLASAGVAAMPVAAAPTVVSADPAVIAAVRDEADGKLKSFYRARRYWPLWVEGDALSPAAARFLATLERADLDGLDPDRYDLERLHRLVAAAADGQARALAKAEIALSQALASYVREVRAPQIDILYADASVAPERLRPDEVLSAAARAPDFTAYVRAQGWMSPLYVRLREALADEGDADKRALLRLNMDRARLLPGGWTRHIVVDAATQRLMYFDDGAQAGEMRVVVGTPETPTPMMAGMLRYATLNPYWNVPTDLVRKRIAPRMLKGASLTKLRYEALSSWDADATALDPKGIDWRAVADGREELRVRELPGRGNSMGTVKFMFPNEEGIYLHDTNDKTLFRKPVRFFSNGCVRLEDAPRLARWLFGHPLAPDGPTPEQHVSLAQPVPVFLLYFTASPVAGGIAYPADRYDRDGALGHEQVASR